jgi:HNH endonuclease.
MVREGYMRIWAPQHPKAVMGYVSEHVLVWEQAHPDDPIKDGEIIHHIDGDKLNNAPDNLQKMSKAEHRKHAPRGVFRNGRSRVASVGETFAVEMLGVTLKELNIGADGILHGRKVEIKTRKPSNTRKHSWQFQIDKPDAEQYLFVTVNSELQVQAVWLIPTLELRGRQAISLTPTEHRNTSGQIDPWQRYRLDQVLCAQFNTTKLQPLLTKIEELSKIAPSGSRTITPRLYKRTIGQFEKLKAAILQEKRATFNAAYTTKITGLTPEIVRGYLSYLNKKGYITRVKLGVYTLRNIDEFKP